MSRRDTILVAVLINMGLLVVLFIGALKPDPLPEMTKIATSIEPSRPQVIEQTVDPVDHLLKSYVEEIQKEPELVEIVKPVLTRQETPKPVEQKPIEEGKYYIVKSGDNPWSVAIKNHIKFDELLRLNNLDEDKAKKLKPGDKLRIK